MRPEVMEILSKSLTEHIQQNARNKLSTEYLLANDARLCANFTDNIMSIGNMCIQDGDNAVGLVVGNSYIHSILPELKLRGVLICDVNNDVLEYSHYLTSCILQSSKYDTFEAQKQYILDRILSKEKNPFFSKKFKEDFQRKVESLKDLHFLASQQRLELCRTWLAQSQCVCLNVNLAEYEQVRKIGEILKNHHVSIIFLNMTNLRDYVPRLSENLKTLPIAKKAVFLWTFIPAVPSASLSRNQLIKSHLSASIDDYEQVYKHSREEYFFPSHTGLCWYGLSLSQPSEASSLNLQDCYHN